MPPADSTPEPSVPQGHTRTLFIYHSTLKKQTQETVHSAAKNDGNSKGKDYGRLNSGLSCHPPLGIVPGWKTDLIFC